MRHSIYPEYASDGSRPSPTAGGKDLALHCPITRKAASDAETTDLVRRMTAEIENPSLPIQYTYDDLKATIPYTTGLHIMRQGCHSGQRKLLLSEIEFLSCCAPDGLVVYAGSAPCEKLPLLLAMFPRVKFLLIDPNYHTFNTALADAPPPVYVYQNVDRISRDAVAHVRRDLKLATKRDLSVADNKRLQNALLVDQPFVYEPGRERQRYAGNMSDIDHPDHIAHMRRMQREFEMIGHKTLIADIMAGSSRAYIIQDYMTLALCELLATSMRAADITPCFISDLRTNFFSPAPIDLDFIWNDALQFICMKILQPAWSMLKFHPPYMDYKTSRPFIDEMLAGSTNHVIYATIRHDLEMARVKYGLDGLASYMRGNHKYTYIHGTTIWLQAWGPASTSEARLIVSRTDLAGKFATYDAHEWDDRFMYNKRLRGYAYYGSLFGKIKHRRDHEYDGCFDCMMEMLILLNYAYLPDANAGERSPTIDVDRLATIFEKPEAQDAVLRLRRQIDDVVVYSPYAKCSFHGQIVKPVKTPIFYSFKQTGSVIQLYCDEKSGKVITKAISQQDDPEKTHLSVAMSIKPDPADWPKFWRRVQQSIAEADADGSKN